MPYKRVKAQGTTFVFKYELDVPDILHIYARHKKEPDDAIYLFFEGPSYWNLKRGLYETIVGTEGLWWFWIDEEARIVMVVSCFDTYRK